MSGTRFTAYLSDQERAKLRQAAREAGTSENYFMRNALRAALGLSVDRIFQTDQTDKTRVGVTR